MSLRPVILTVAILAGCYLLGWALLGLLFWVMPPPERPTDAGLAQQYFTNRAAFAELRDLLVANPSLVDASSTNASPLAWQRYTGLRCKTGVSKAYHEAGEYRFLVGGSGFASKGYRLAIVWRETAPDRVIASLDDFRKTTHEWEHAYRRLVSMDHMVTPSNHRRQRTPRLRSVCISGQRRGAAAADRYLEAYELR